MGMDIVAIMEHNMDLEEILRLPQTINQWKDLHECYNTIGDNRANEINAEWEAGMFEVTPAFIESGWDEWENGQFISSYYVINSRILRLYVNRHTIMANPGLYHKYANLEYYDIRNNLMKYLRLVAQKFKSRKILYCVDSACSTAWIEEKARAGLTLDQLIEYGLNQYGKIPPTLTEAVHNYFFVDDFTLDLEDYPPDQSVLFDRCIEEYILEEKFGRKYIIFNR